MWDLIITANPSSKLLVNIGRVKYAKNVLRDVSLTGNNETIKFCILVANFKHGTLEDDEKDGLKIPWKFKSEMDANDYVVKFEPTDLKINNFAWGRYSPRTRPFYYVSKNTWGDF